MTRRTKSNPTNRQKQEATPDPLEWMKKMKYPKFRFFAEWLEFIDTLPKLEGYKLLFQIKDYGLYETTTQKLTPEAEEYFIRVIRPELNRQHKRFNEGKRI